MLIFLIFLKLLFFHRTALERHLWARVIPLLLLRYSRKVAAAFHLTFGVFIQKANLETERTSQIKSVIKL